MRDLDTAHGRYIKHISKKHIRAVSLLFSHRELSWIFEMAEKYFLVIFVVADIFYDSDQQQLGICLTGLWKKCLAKRILARIPHCLLRLFGHR